MVTDLERFKTLIPYIVDMLPDEDEVDVINALFWERATLREVAERKDWVLSSGEFDGKKVERVRDRALARIESLADAAGVEVAK